MTRTHTHTRSILLAVVLAAATVATLGAGGVAAQSATEHAELGIVQPEYVESGVETTVSDGDRIYRVEGPRHVISLQNVAHSDVTGFGVSDGSGSLDYDAGLDAYTYRPEGNGTATLYWTAQEQDGNTTTVTRYEAVIQTSRVDWVHRTSEEDVALREKAGKYDEIESEVRHLAPGESVDSVISSSLTYYRFFDAPFSTLINDMRGVLLMMALRPGGWIIGGFFLAIALLGVAGGARYRNRTQKQLRDIGDIEVEKTEAYLKKAQRILSNCDYNEFLPDDAARSMRDLLGRNPWIGFKNYLLMRSPQHVKGLVLQMMAQLGYEGRAECAPDGSITDAWVVQPDPSSDGDGAVPDGGAAVNAVDLAALRPENPDDQAFIQAIDGGALDFDVFNADIDPDDVEFPISNREVDDAELLEELNPHFPDDFEDEEHLARALGEVVEFVVNHDHTDDWGRSRRDLDLLSFLAELDSVLADEADFPLGHVQRRMLVYIADNMDTEAELTETVERLEEDGVQ